MDKFPYSRVAARIVCSLESELKLGNVDKCDKDSAPPIELAPLVGSAQRSNVCFGWKWGIGFKQPVCILWSDLSQSPMGCRLRFDRRALASAR
jgi:hypothetical protein